MSPQTARETGRENGGVVSEVLSCKQGNNMHNLLKSSHLSEQESKSTVLGFGEFC